MRVISIDPGYERVGIAILEKTVNQKETVLFSECFKTSPLISLPERIYLIGGEIKRVIKKYEPSALAIETLFFTKNQKTVMGVSEARGVIIYEGISAKLKVFEYTPLQIKIAITGYGKATKEQIEIMARKLTTIKTEVWSDDELDAIAIGITYFACLPARQACNKL